MKTVKNRRKKWIRKAFNIVFSEMGIYKGQIAPLIVEKVELKFQELNFRPFILRKVYNVIDNLDNNKAPESGYINAWALKSRKYAIGTHLQIIFNDCIHEKDFQQFKRMPTSHQFSKNEMFFFYQNYRPNSVTPTFAKVCALEQKTIRVPI